MKLNYFCYKTLWWTALVEVLRRFIDCVCSRMLIGVNVSVHRSNLWINFAGLCSSRFSLFTVFVYDVLEIVD